MRHVDPAMKKYESEDLTTCTKCGAFMMSLSEYDLRKSGEGPTMDGEWYEVLLWGWMTPVYSFVYNAITYKERQAKLAQLKREHLTEFPNSLVCPSCWHVKKR